MWWCMPGIPALKKQMQEDHREFKVASSTYQFPGQPGLYSEILTQDNTKTLLILSFALEEFDSGFEAQKIKKYSLH